MQNFNEYNYQILETNTDYRESKIEKTNIKAVFTLKQVDEQIDYLNKLKKEISGKLEIEKAKMVNLEENNPIVKTIEPKDAIAVTLYEQAKAFIAPAVSKLAEVEKVLAETENEKVHIINTLKIDTTLKADASKGGVMIEEFQPNAESQENK